jgi:hypothetical protein
MDVWYHFRARYRLKVLRIAHTSLSSLLKCRIRLAQWPSYSDLEKNDKNERTFAFSA